MAWPARHAAANASASSRSRLIAQIDAHGKESLNFQISMLIYNVIAGILCLVLIGFVILGILHILNLVLVIVASIQASDGKFYRYPLTIRLIK